MTITRNEYITKFDKWKGTKEEFNLFAYCCAHNPSFYREFELQGAGNTLKKKERDCLKGYENWYNHMDKEMNKKNKQVKDMFIILSK